MKDSGDQIRLSDGSGESNGKELKGSDLEGGTLPRRMSYQPRLAGLGLAVCSDQDETLEHDLMHHEDEKLSPRETPWATPRVSPRLGSLGSRSGSYSCTIKGGAYTIK